MARTDEHGPGPPRQPRGEQRHVLDLPEWRVEFAGPPLDGRKTTRTATAYPKAGGRSRDVYLKVFPADERWRAKFEKERRAYTLLNPALDVARESDPLVGCVPELIGAHIDPTSRQCYIVTSELRDFVSVEKWVQPPTKRGEDEIVRKVPVESVAEFLRRFGATKQAALDAGVLISDTSPGNVLVLCWDRKFAVQAVGLVDLEEVVFSDNPQDQPDRSTRAFGPTSYDRDGAPRTPIGETEAALKLAHYLLTSQTAMHSLEYVPPSADGRRELGPMIDRFMTGVLKRSYDPPLERVPEPIRWFCDTLADLLEQTQGSTQLIERASVISRLLAQDPPQTGPAADIAAELGPSFADDPSARLVAARSFREIAAIAASSRRAEWDGRAADQLAQLALTGEASRAAWQDTDITMLRDLEHLLDDRFLRAQHPSKRRRTDPHALLWKSWAVATNNERTLNEHARFGAARPPAEPKPPGLLRRGVHRVGSVTAAKSLSVALWTLAAAVLTGAGSIALKLDDELSAPLNAPLSLASWLPIVIYIAVVLMLIALTAGAMPGGTALLAAVTALGGIACLGFGIVGRATTAAFCGAALLVACWCFAVQQAPLDATPAPPLRRFQQGVTFAALASLILAASIAIVPTGIAAQKLPGVADTLAGQVPSWMRPEHQGKSNTWVPPADSENLPISFGLDGVRDQPARAIADTTLRNSGDTAIRVELMGLSVESYSGDDLPFYSIRVAARLLNTGDSPEAVDENRTVLVVHGDFPDDVEPSWRNPTVTLRGPGSDSLDVYAIPPVYTAPLRVEADEMPELDPDEHTEVVFVFTVFQPVEPMNVLGLARLTNQGTALASFSSATGIEFVAPIDDNRNDIAPFFGETARTVAPARLDQVVGLRILGVEMLSDGVTTHVLIKLAVTAWSGGPYSVAPPDFVLLLNGAPAGTGPIAGSRELSSSTGTYLTVQASAHDSPLQFDAGPAARTSWPISVLDAGESYVDLSWQEGILAFSVPGDRDAVRDAFTGVGWDPASTGVLYAETPYAGASIAGVFASRWM